MKFDKDYWETRYTNGETGWDVGKITTPIKAYIDQIKNKEIKILIPGAGNSYEFEYLLENNFTNSFVIDIASQPIQNIKQRTNCSDNKLIEGDFFKYNEKYDLIIEQTFFCALNPDLREQYVKKMHDLLNEKGKLVGLLFQFPLTEVGPPFGGSIEEYKKIFSNYFEIKTLETCYNSIKPRENREVFIIFEKK
jgi:methyl halide transferase